MTGLRLSAEEQNFLILAAVGRTKDDTLENLTVWVLDIQTAAI